VCSSDLSMKSEFCLRNAEYLSAIHLLSPSAVTTISVILITQGAKAEL